MLRKFFTTLAAAFAIAGCGGSGDAVTWPAASRLVTFGDSWSDGGAEKALSQKMVAEGVPGAYVFPGPEAIYPAGNWSNGPSAVDQTAAAWGVPSENYAMGGASSGRRLYDNPPGVPPLIDAYLPEGGGVLGQVDRYVVAKSGAIDANAVHVLWASGNDFFLFAEFGLPGTPASIAVQAVTNFEQAFATLKQAGARRFLFVNSQYAPNASKFYGQAFDDFKDTYNPALAQAVARLQAANPSLDIRLYDVYSAVKNILDNPASYALNVKQPCQVTLAAAPPPPCANPDSYFYWDEFHPSRKGFSLIATELMKVYK